MLPVYKRQPGVYVKGEGVWLYDAEGNRILDFLSGIAVNALGHCHPAVVEALQRQASTLIHVSNGLVTEPPVLLAKKLTELSGMDRVFFSNCGTTAIETALKIAKKFGKDNDKPEIITLNRSFHGRTLGAVSATAQAKHQDPFKPLLQGFVHIEANDMDSLRNTFSDRTAAILLEPVQGEGGLTTITDEFMQEARALCDKFGALLIVDEIQTGIGRTGTWFAYQKMGVIPDVLCLAKALGGGVPIGACLTRGKANTVMSPGEHGSTFGGNPLVCSVGLTVLETIESENLVKNAEERGTQLGQLLSGIRPDLLLEIRGKGLMRGVVLSQPVAREVVTKCVTNGLLINATDDYTLRILPALIVTEEQVIEAVSRLKTVLDSFDL